MKRGSTTFFAIGFPLGVPDESKKEKEKVPLINNHFDILIEYRKYNSTTSGKEHTYMYDVVGVLVQPERFPPTHPSLPSISEFPPSFLE
jgi:hypothetical protein